MPTRELLDRWDAHVRADRCAGQRLIAPAEARGTVLRAPATEAQLVAAEQRLGVELPPSYRAFLALTNGADARGPGPVLDMERPDAGLLPVDEVEWAALAEPFLVDLWTELMDLPAGYSPPLPGDEPVQVEDYEPLNRALLVGGRQSRPGVFLVPVSGQHDWQVWLLHWEGAQAYRSLADLLRFTADQPLPAPPTTAEIDSMVDAIRGGDLTDLGVPPVTAGTAVLDRLADVAIEILVDDAILFGPLPSWARLADDPIDLFRRERDLRAAPLVAAGDRSDAAPALRRALGAATRADARVTLLGALVDLGAPDTRELLAEAATDDDPQLRGYAVFRLSERHDVSDDEIAVFLARDDDPQVRAVAFEALLRRDPPEPVLQLLRAAAPAMSLRSTFATAVKRRDEDDASRTLWSAADQDDAEMRQWALDQLVRREVPGAMERLCEVVANDHTGWVRKWAVARLAQLDRNDTA